MSISDFGSEERIDFVRRMPCIICKTSPCENHHVVSRGAGGGPEHIVPLCKAHHLEYHNIGRHTFQQKYKVDLLEEAKLVANFLSHVEKAQDDV